MDKRPSLPPARDGLEQRLDLILAELRTLTAALTAVPCPPKPPTKPAAPRSAPKKS